MSNFGPRIFDVMRHAVTLVRDQSNERIRSMEALRRELLKAYQGEDALVDKALKVWVAHAQSNGLG